jgi:hypothetical protein
MITCRWYFKGSEGHINWNPEKCQVFHYNVPYLGNTLLPDGEGMDRKWSPQRQKAVEEPP